MGDIKDAAAVFGAAIEKGVKSTVQRDAADDRAAIQEIVAAVTAHNRRLVDDLRTDIRRALAERPPQR